MDPVIAIMEHLDWVFILFFTLAWLIYLIQHPFYVIFILGSIGACVYYYQEIMAWAEPYYHEILSPFIQEYLAPQLDKKAEMKDDAKQTVAKPDDGPKPSDRKPTTTANSSTEKPASKSSDRPLERSEPSEPTAQQQPQPIVTAPEEEEEEEERSPAASPSVATGNNGESTKTVESGEYVMVGKPKVKAPPVAPKGRSVRML